MRLVAAGCPGLLFGVGLALSGMIDPARVLAFIDVYGAWGPSLEFVLTGAVTVAGCGHAVSRPMPRPLFDASTHLPARSAIDAKLVVGAAVFGIGWGLAGFCPGPDLAGLVLGLPSIAVFVAAMLAGMWLHRATSVRASAPASGRSGLTGKAS